MGNTTDKVFVKNNVLDRLSALESKLREVQDYSLTPQDAGQNIGQPDWNLISGWVTTGSAFQDTLGRIVLDSIEPSITIAAGGHIRSADFETGVSGFDINGGTAEFNDVTVRGTIYATVGQIGGWTIAATALTGGGATLHSSGYLLLGAGNNVVRLDAGDAVYRLWIGNAAAASAPFNVTREGVLTATGATIQSAGTGARIILDGTGIKGYDATTQRYQISNDGSGWLGDVSIFAWTAAGVVTLNGSAVMPNTILGGKTNFFNTPIIDGLVITNNSPAAGRVAWSAFTLTYQGTSYAVSAGNTALATHKFVYWNKAVSTTVLQTSITPPAQAVDQFIVIFNEGGTGVASLFSNIVYADYISTVNLAAIQANLGACHIDGVLDIAAAGGIYQGTGTFASPTTGLKVWNDGGVGRIAGYNETLLQWYASTDGKLYAGAGSVTLDASGLTVRGMGSGDVIEVGGSISTIKLTSPTGGLVKGQVYYQGTNNISSALGINVNDYGTAVGFIRLDNKTVLVHGLDVGYTGSAAGDGEIIASQDGRFGGGLYVGATNVDPAAGTLTVTGTVTAGGTITTQSNTIPLVLISCHNDIASYRPEVRFRRSRNTMASPTAVASGDWIVALYSYAHDGTNYNTNAGQIRLEVLGAVSAGVIPSRWAFATMNAAGALADRMTIEPAGSIAFPAVSPASLAAHTNNWAPGGGSFVRVTSNGDYNITGMVAGVDGEVRHISNVGVYALTLTHEDASSTAANRFSFKSYANFVIAKKGGIIVQYDATDARWRSIAYTY